MVLSHFVFLSFHQTMTLYQCTNNDDDDVDDDDDKLPPPYLLQTMEILRRYCMGSEPVNFQIVSDQKECLRSVVSGRANYEDEFYSVSVVIVDVMYIVFQSTSCWNVVESAKKELRPS